jgi:hypothetical protein
MPEVEGRHNGRQILVPVAIAPPLIASQTVVEPAVGLIDTGATRSLIIRELAERLSLPFVGKHRLVSARSEEQVDQFAFRVGFQREVGQWPWFLDGDFIGLEFRNLSNFQVIIGMDIIALGTFETRPDRSWRFLF